MILRYSGTLSDRASLTALREEFQDIAAANGWPVDLLEPQGFVRDSRRGGALLAPPLALEGLRIIIHPQTDPLWLTFDEGGALTRLAAWPGRGEAASGFLNQSEASMQTGIGGWELHSTAVRLLDRLKRAYVNDLQVLDESGFWDSRDLGSLKRRMGGR